MLVYEAVDGTIEIRYRDRVMRWTEHLASTPPVTAPARVHTPAPGARRNRPNVSPDHPWHHGGADYYVFQQRAKDRLAWERVQP